MWKTVREVVFRFSYWGRPQEKRKTRSFFVFLTAVRSKKNELTVYTRTVIIISYHHITSNDAMPKFQSAYRQFHSTETALIKIFNDLLLAADQGQVSALCLLDLTSAFDTYC